jgi:outer membrane receptor protein involved in Fe transport
MRTRGEEFGLRTVLVPKVQTTVALWGLTLDSELVFVGDAGTTEPGRPSRRYGIEWANYFSPTRWLTLDADMSWSSARFTDGDPAGPEIPGAVRRVASVGMSINDVRRPSGGAHFRYLGRRPLIEDNRIQSGRSFDVDGGYRLSPRLRLSVDVLNLFDTRASDIDYFCASRFPGEPLEGVEDVHTHPVQPRTARVSLQVTF